MRIPTLPEIQQQERERLRMIQIETEALLRRKSWRRRVGDWFEMLGAIAVAVGAGVFAVVAYVVVAAFTMALVAAPFVLVIFAAIWAWRHL